MIDSLLFALKAPGRWFGADTFHALFMHGWIVDGRDGGLVVGRRHAAGNIYMIKQAQDKFHFFAAMEGGEFILNHKASERHMVRLKQLNSDPAPTDIEPAEIPLSKFTRVLNLNAMPFDKLLLIDDRGQFIANRRSTQKHYRELERLNDDISDFRACDPNQMVKKQNA